MDNEYWMYEDPWGAHIFTKKQAIDGYWDYWVKEMLRVNKSHLCTRENCFEDWVCVNWAFRINPPMFEKWVAAPEEDPEKAYRERQLAEREGR